MTTKPSMTAAAKPTAAHTPGPLALTKIASPIYGSDGSLVAEGVGIGAMNSVYVATVTGRKRDADAARLVACWNACDGISTDALADGAIKTTLQQMGEAHNTVSAERDALRAEVARLREALQRIERLDYEALSVTDRACFNSAVMQARAALGGGK